MLSSAFNEALSSFHTFSSFTIEIMFVQFCFRSLNIARMDSCVFQAHVQSMFPKKNKQKKHPKTTTMRSVDKQVNSSGTLFAYLDHLPLKSNPTKIIIYLLLNQAASSISQPTLWLLLKSLCSRSATQGWSHENIV